ncbi:MAG: hypothetical protein ACLQGU_04345 [bacterium]
MEKEKKLIDLQDMVENSADKISFLSTFFILINPDEEVNLTNKDASGVVRILQEIRKDLDFVVDQLSKKRDKGLIIEEKMGS